MSKNSGNSIVWRKVQEIDQEATAAAMRAARINAKRTQSHVARCMGFQPAYISDLEKGFRKWTEKKCDAFLSALNAASEGRRSEA